MRKCENIEINKKKVRPYLNLARDLVQNFSGYWSESTYFLAAARLEKTRFLSTAAEKSYATLGHKKRMSQLTVYHPRLRLGR